MMIQSGDRVHFWWALNLVHKKRGHADTVRGTDSLVYDPRSAFNSGGGAFRYVIYAHGQRIIYIQILPPKSKGTGCA